MFRLLPIIQDGSVVQLGMVFRIRPVPEGMYLIAADVTGYYAAANVDRRGSGYFPAAFLSASLIRSCQPGPDSWKYSSTS